MGKVMRAIGLMSGTSLDGIDIAVIETDGEAFVRRGPSASLAYPNDFRDRLRQAIADAKGMSSREERPGCLADVETELTQRHADAVLSFMGDRMLQPSAVDVIGFHGQTVLHKLQMIKPFGDVQLVPGEVERMMTVQIGDGHRLAALTGIDVVYDMRGADCIAGGQGAPLAPVYHRALVARIPQRPIAVVNIGGVANVTWIGADGSLIAFDTGPGNALIDDWMLAHTGTASDVDGKAAASGQVIEDALHALLSHPHFGLGVPKSLDRQAFDPTPLNGASVADGAATLTAFTAAAIARAREHFPEQPALWIVCGGGRRNKTLMGMIAGRVENAVVPAEAVGFDGDMLEAEAWGYLAVRSLTGMPLSFPGTTGVPVPQLGGVLVKAP